LVPIVDNHCTCRYNEKTAGSARRWCNQQEGGLHTAIYHCSIKIISRGKGKSAVAAAAYRAGEKITNDFDGVTHDYTRKGGVVHTEILLPENAPAAYRNRAALWNAVEKSEKAKNAQLAREIELAIPQELTREQGISLVREYVREQFVNAGMCADTCIHDKGEGNPHAHVMLTVRPLNNDGSWGAKQRKAYILDKNGNKIYDRKKRTYKCSTVPTTDWNETTKAEEWRSAWAEICNRTLERNGQAERVDHRSYERQGIEQIPTVHLGTAAFQMEKRGIRTERGDLNREIELTNAQLRQGKARINKLRDWLHEEHADIDAPTLGEYVERILRRQPQEGRSQHTQTSYNLQDGSKLLFFLEHNKIWSMEAFDEYLSSMLNRRADLQKELNTAERRISTLEKHLEQSDIFFRFSGKKKLSESDQILFDAAKRYLQGVMNGRTRIPVKAWKRELADLLDQKKLLYYKYTQRKDEVKNVEQIRRSVDSIIREEERDRARRRGQNVLS